jgi:hypothetical protein
VDHLVFLKQIASMGGKANKGTPQAKIRAGKAGRARWAKHNAAKAKKMNLNAKKEE